MNTAACRWLVVLLLLGGCSAAPQRPATPEYVVRAGDTVYSIARRYGVDYHELARWNGLPADYAIRVGQHLRLSAGGAQASAPRPSPVPSTASAAPAAPPPPPPTFSWPAEGRVAGVIERPNGGFGLRIDGTQGTPVRAAAAGRVVYLGSGLRAYGLLVIIRHDDHYLTAYGNNQTFTVGEGEQVPAGAPIGTMGTNADGAPMLYFEIRREGRPVNPLELLPPRKDGP